MISGNRSNSFFSGPGIGIGRIDDEDDLVEDGFWEGVDGFDAANFGFEVDGDVGCALLCVAA